MNVNNLRIFGLGSSATFAYSVAKKMGVELNTVHEERRPDGEIYTTALDNVRGCDVFVISSLCGDKTESVDEKLMKTLIFIHTLHHASADRITLVAPFLAYMRQDRKTESRAPIATQATAIMLESIGMDRLLTMDVHNLGAEQNAFRVPVDNLEARKLLADAIAANIHEMQGEFKVLSPDAGGTARTKAFQYSLNKRVQSMTGPVGIAYADKSRIDANTVKVQIIGDVLNKNIIIVDDMIGTGSTVVEVADAVIRQGGNVWGVVATHGLYVNNAPYKLQKIPRIYTADTVDPFRVAGTGLLSQINVVPTAPMFAEAILRIHLGGGSISELLND